MSQPIVSLIELQSPWVLVLGRKRRTVKEPGRLEHRRDMEEVYYRVEDLSPSALYVASETVRLFIGERLFGTVVIEPKRKRSRFSLRLIKPTDKKKPVEIRVTKRMFKLEPGVVV